MVDKPKTGTEGNKPQVEKPSAPVVSDTGRSSSPTSASQSKAENTSNRGKYAKYIVWPVIAMYRFLRGSFLLADQHSGGITALATVAIVVLTIFYVKYSKKQWETMQRQLNDSKAVQAAQITVGIETLKVTEDQDNYFADFNIVVENVGGSSALRTVLWPTRWENQSSDKKYLRYPEPSTDAFIGVEPRPTGFTIGAGQKHILAKHLQLPNKAKLDSREFLDGFILNVEYFDVFGNKLGTAPCWEFVARRKAYYPCERIE